MSVELRPLGVTCNLGCDYCYQDPLRAAGNQTRRYDLDAMLASLRAIDRPFTLFGGEPLLVDVDTLERLWEYGYRRFGHNVVQTNGTLITATHLDLFDRYNVQVGISVDGPAELNDVRRGQNTARTRAATQATHDAIAQLCDRGRPPGLIVTLHQKNASSQHLLRMADWFRELDRRRITSVRLHLLEADSPGVAQSLGLSAEANVEAIRFFAALQTELRHIRFDVVEEIRHLLLGEDRSTSCVWHGCDPYTTPAVTGIEGDGGTSNCGRTNTDGVDFLKADEIGHERSLALFHTPQEHNGCQGCRFFLMCQGQCPGTAVDNDWRNRSEHCQVWKTIFAVTETQLLEEGKQPLSLSPKLPALEAELVSWWEQGRSTSLTRLLNPA